jgi:FkbM family methyltransferase
MRQLISTLSRSASLRRLVQVLRLHKLSNWWLHRFPLVKNLPGSGILYRATRLESIPLAVEMFEKGNLYNAALLPENFTTFADLGCNVGYFTCWLAHLADGRKLKGIMLDANPEAVQEASWHARANGWNDVFALHGIVGETAKDGSVDFFLYESNICSASQLPDVEAMGLKGRWTKISVPRIKFEEQWRKHFGDVRCQVLKVDIEGSEMNFLKAEQSFLKLVDSILLEWHKWRVSLDEVKALLASQGFKLIKVLEENEQMGTAYFRLESRR